MILENKVNGKIAYIAKLDGEDAELIQPLFERNPNTQFNPASVMKTCLCAVAIDAMELAGDDLSTLIKVARRGARSRFVKIAKFYTIDELIHASLMWSDALASITLSGYIAEVHGRINGTVFKAGSDEENKFTVALMNDKVAELGMVDTVAGFPTGAARFERQKSTAVDLVKLAQMVVRKYPSLLKAMGATQFLVVAKDRKGEEVDESLQINHRSKNVRDGNGYVSSKTGTMENRVELIIYSTDEGVFIIVSFGEIEKMRRWRKDGKVMMEPLRENRANLAEVFQLDRYLA